MFEDEPEGATPVDEDEAADLLPPHIRTRDELNVWEQQNILEAALWAARARTAALTESAIRELHRRMFDRTWGSAGKYRTSDKNIGVYWATIPVAIRNLIDDGVHWLAHQIFPIDEAAIRMHHRMVKIHPFPNGNGRHARLWCDMLLAQNDRGPIAWKSRELDGKGEARRAYIDALRQADREDYQPLLTLMLKGRGQG